MVIGGTVVGYRPVEDTTFFVVQRDDSRIVQRDNQQVTNSPQ